MTKFSYNKSFVQLDAFQHKMVQLFSLQKESLRNESFKDNKLDNLITI